jgi:ABC-type uncharacterized transport system substrate-binding protein
LVFSARRRPRYRLLSPIGWQNSAGPTAALFKIVYRWGNGRTERFGELAAELVLLKVDVTLTSGSATRQTMKEISEIPIAFALASEPVATGMVTSLSRPGGNVTRLSLEAPDLGGKRLALLREIAPAARRPRRCRLSGFHAGARAHQGGRSDFGL